jgi:hypothetical protein
MDITIFVIALILTLTIGTIILVPYLKKKWDENMWKWVTLAVKAAEQIFKGTGLGETKKAYVLEFLKSKGYNVNSSAINIALEAAVLELNKALAAS